MERKDLLLANAQIFSAQGKALAEVASRNVEILVVGNPANTNALIARENAQGLDPRNFTAMMRLDHNRARAQLAAKTGSDARGRARRDDLGQPLRDAVPRPRARDRRRHRRRSRCVPQAWYREEFIPTVQQRGAAIIKARGASSAASAASAAIDHVRDWALGTHGDDWVSMAVPSDGSYGIPEGVVYWLPGPLRPRRVPASCRGSRSTTSRAASWTATDKELREERAGVADLI